MSRTYRGELPLIAVLSIGTTLLLGCGSTAPSLEDPEPRPLGRELPSVVAPPADEEPEPSVFVEPVGTLTLRHALAAALIHNPRLASFSWEIRAREAEVFQAGRRPNPELGGELENFAGSGEFGGLDGSETTIVLSQLIQLGGKRGKQIAVARYEQNLAAWDYETARIDVFTETTKTFIQVLADQEALGVTEELVAVAEEVLTSVSRRVRAGSTSPVEEGRARVELETSRIAQARAERALAAARTRLSAMWGTSTPEFSDAAGNIEDVPVVPSLEDLRTRIEQNPALARWMSELDHRRAAIDLEQARGVPDLSVGAGVRYFSGIDDAALVVELGLPLPVFDRNRGASQAAEMRLKRGEQEQRDATVRVHAQLAVAHQALRAADVEVRGLRDRALPEAETASQSAQDAYLRGSMRLIDVLDTQRLLFDLKGRYFGALARYHAAIADLERLAGESIQTAAEDSTGIQP